MAFVAKLRTTFRKPEIAVVLAALIIGLRACSRLIALIGPAWVIGQFSQSLRNGLSLYLRTVADMFRISSTVVWWWYGYTVASSVSSLVIAWFLWRHRPWARVALFIVLGLDSVREVVFSVASWPQIRLLHPTVDPRVYYGKLIFDLFAYYALPIFILTRGSIVQLFSQGRHR